MVIEFTNEISQTWGIVSWLNQVQAIAEKHGFDIQSEQASVSISFEGFNKDEKDIEGLKVELGICRLFSGFRVVRKDGKSL